MYAATSVKRQKITREVLTARAVENIDFFQGVGKIEYKPEIANFADEQFFYRHFNASDRIHGRPMEDWLRASVSYTTHSLYKSAASMEDTKRSIRAMFELALKLGVKFWSAYEDDLTVDGESFDDAQNNYEQLIEILSDYQQKAGIRPLWIGVKFKHPRFLNGFASNADMLALAGYQAKRALDIAHKLNAENFLVNDFREKYNNTAINCDLAKEMRHYARFMKLIVEYRDKIGFRGQLLIDSNNECTNETHSLLFLKQFDLDRYFRVNVSNLDEFHTINTYGSLGCINVTKPISDNTTITLLLRSVIEKGGLGQSGITFLLPPNYHFVDPKEMMESYISALDTYSKCLRLAVRLVNDTAINKHVQMRYANFQSGWGAKFLTADASLNDCEEIAKKLQETNTIYNKTSSSMRWFCVLQRFIDFAYNSK